MQGRRQIWPLACPLVCSLACPLACSPARGTLLEGTFEPDSSTIAQEITSPISRRPTHLRWCGGRLRWHRGAPLRYINARICMACCAPVCMVPRIHGHTTTHGCTAHVHAHAVVHATMESPSTTRSTRKCFTPCSKGCSAHTGVKAWDSGMASPSPLPPACE